MEKPVNTDKRMLIMQTAEQLFAEEGFDGTSVRDIAQAANVNLAMISYYFGSKEKLLAAIFEHRINTMRLRIENMLEDTSITPLQKVHKLIEHYVDKMLSTLNFHKLMVREQMVMKNGDVRDAIHKAKCHNHDLIKKLMSEGQKQGVFKKNIDIPLMVATLIGTTNHFITTQHFYRLMHGLESMPDDEFRQLLRKKLLHHLKTLFKAILTYEG